LRNAHANMDTDNPSILIVEDNERLRAGLALVLEAHSFRVRSAATQPEALRHLKTEFFSLVIADYMLAAAGDHERVARALLEAAYPVPVGCLSGWSDIPPHLNRQYAFVLRKPVTAENLLAAIRSLSLKKITAAGRIKR